MLKKKKPLDSMSYKNRGRIYKKLVNIYKEYLYFQKLKIYFGGQNEKIRMTKKNKKLLLALYHTGGSKKHWEKLHKIWEKGILQETPFFL